MSAGAIAGVAFACAAALLALGAWRLGRRHPRISAGPRRILFPVAGTALSEPALDAAVRIARAEHATLVPSYLASVPLHLPLDAALPLTCEAALPVLEAIEQRAAAAGVPVDSRIERGRGYRHALSQLVAHEGYDRIVVAAGPGPGDAGFTAADMAWLLAHAPGEIVVLRPAEGEPESARRPLAA
jgi:nucleotide-binding universal stress UspA family protein